MTTNTTGRQLVWVALVLVGALIVLPLLFMGFGMMGAGPMMGWMWGNGMWGAGGESGWMLVFGLVMPLLFIVLIIGAGYLGYRALTSQGGSSDPALQELRTAYARGDLSDDEYERRRERLENES